ncbi:MAG: xanthine dehydrogenase family protein subunit M [Pseudomonadota bacterium]
MYRFDYANPQSIESVVESLQADSEATIIAGGMTLLPTMKLRLAAPSQLLDITRIDTLHGIQIAEGEISIGAATTHARVAADAQIQTRLPALAGLANGIGDPQVRNRGTLGGSVANNDPAADYPAAVLALNATIVTDRREISADDFFTDMFETALDDDEIIVSVKFPIPEFANYVKFPSPASRYALVGVFVARSGGQVRVAITGAGPYVFRFKDAEAALEQRFHADALVDVSYPADELNEDLHADASYRANLITVLTKRALTSG